MATPVASFSVPPGATAKVHIIDSTTRITDMPANILLSPSMQGVDTIAEFGSWCFLVQSSKGQKVLFDLATPLDVVSTLPPAFSEQIRDAGVKFEATKQVAEILKENGVDPAEISSVIWRYEKYCYHKWPARC